MNKKDNWWVRMNDEFNTEDKMDLLPDKFVKTFNSIIRNARETQADVSLDKNKDKHGYYDQIKNLEKLRTNEEIEKL